MEKYNIGLRHYAFSSNPSSEAVILKARKKGFFLAFLVELNNRQTIAGLFQNASQKSTINDLYKKEKIVSDVF